MQNKLIIVIFILYSNYSIIAGSLDISRELEKQDKSSNQLYSLIQYGNLEQLKIFLENNKFDLNKPIYAQYTPLILAIEFGKEGILRYLVQEKKVSVNNLQIESLSPIIYAVNKSNLTIIKFLVEETDANLESTDRHGHNAFYDSIIKGNLEIIKYFFENKKLNLNIMRNIFGIVGTYLANLSKQNHVIQYFASKGFLPFNKNKTKTIMSQLLYNNKNNFDNFELIIYHQIPINYMKKKNLINIYQPKVTPQYKKDEQECRKAELAIAVDNWGGTVKEYKKGDPIEGDTCSYHATKNAFISLLLLYSNKNFIKLSNKPDIDNFTILNTSSFNSQLFMEKVHAKIFNIEGWSLLGQGMSIIQTYIIQDYINNIFIKTLKKRSILPINNHNKFISFIDTAIITNILQTNSNLEYTGMIGLDIFNSTSIDSYNSFLDILDQESKFELLQEIALFREEHDYLHSFILAINAGTTSGYRDPTEEENKLHAISITIEKAGPILNVIICESNNSPVYAIKQVVFDFLDLFTNSEKLLLSDTQQKQFLKYAQNKYRFSIIEAEKFIPSFRLLTETYLWFKNIILFNEILSQKKENILYALFLLSKIKTVYKQSKKALSQREKLEQKRIQTILEQSGLLVNDRNLIRENEINLYNLIQKLH